MWLVRKPEFLNRLTKFSFGGLAIELEQLKSEIKENKQQIASLESDLELSQRTFNEVLQGFDPDAPLDIVGKTRRLLKVNAGSIEDLDAIKGMLSSLIPEQIYAAAVTLRERRPPAYFSDLVNVLDVIGQDDKLKGIRLNTVWTLVSALHRMLIAVIRDNVKPSIPPSELERAKNVLEVLEANPSIQLDRPDAPDKGVRGPIRLSQKWIDDGLSKEIGKS
jgi:hypothetical protein